MAAPYNNVRSKLARAIVAYLQSLGGNVGLAASISPQNIAADSTYPITVVRVTRLRPDPQFVGNYIGPVHITIKGSAATSTRLAFDTRVAATADAMMKSEFSNSDFDYTAGQINLAGRALAISNPATDADMVDFTCLNIYDDGFGDAAPDEEGTAWQEVLVFNIRTCGSNVS